MTNTLASTFSLAPSDFPYTKSTISQKRNFRAALQNELFFDLVLAEVARIPHASKFFPPRNTSDLRSLHEAIETSPVDLLKKQCCIYYLLRDWGTHAAYAKDQLMPSKYCALMDSYWLLDNQQYEEALHCLTTPGLTPNFATKIMSTFASGGHDAMLVTYVQTIQNALDSEDKLRLYLGTLMKLDVVPALMFTRTITTPALREALFESVLDYAKMTRQNAAVLANFPFDTVECGWAVANLSQSSGAGLEALILRSTMMGDVKRAITLRHSHGGGQHELNEAMHASLLPVEQKLLS